MPNQFCAPQAKAARARARLQLGQRKAARIQQAASSSDGSRESDDENVLVQSEDEEA